MLLLLCGVMMSVGWCVGVDINCFVCEWCVDVCVLIVVCWCLWCVLWC